MSVSHLKLLPEPQERYWEEWSSHVQETPEQVGKLLVAAGFLIAAGIRLSYTVPGLSPSPASISFGLFPEPEGRWVVWRQFGDQLVSNDISRHTYRHNRPSIQTARPRSS
jgi:hypothetical protein